MKLRILHIVTYMGRGGLETMLMNYYRNIDREQIQFDFLVHRKECADYDDEIESLGGKIYRLPRLNPWSPKYIKELNDFFEKHKEYKIVHCHLDCMSSIPLRAAKKAGIPIRIAHAHSSNQDKDIKYIPKLYFKRKIPMEATHLFACSKSAGQWMFGQSDVQVLPNAINAVQYEFDDKIRYKIRNQLGVEGSYVLGHVGRFSSVKNHTFLIDVFEQLKKVETNVKLLLVGDGEKYSDIQEKVKNKGLSENVIFLGLRSDVNLIMQAMDVFLLPSLYEGLPVTMIEAQAAGLPCIISDRVPIECKITDLVYQVALDESLEVWVEKILGLKKVKRESITKIIKVSGYDIYESVKVLQEFYKAQIFE